MIVLSRFRFFRYFRVFTHYKLFVSFRSLNFGFNINRINPLFVVISSKLLAITNVIHKFVLWVCRLFQTTIKNCKVPHLRSTDEATSKWRRSLAAINIQVKQHYCTLLAAATGNCDVTNVTTIRISRHTNCLSRVLYVPAPTPVTASYGCCLSHCLLVP